MNLLILTLISMIPFIELRGAIPIGIANGLNPIAVYLCCVLGSTIIGIPLILFFSYILKCLKSVDKFKNIAIKLENKILSKTKKIKKLNLIGIILFVGIPIPTTGSWSASGIASLLKMKVIDSILGIFLGNALAGFIILTLSLNLF